MNSGWLDGPPCYECKFEPKTIGPNAGNQTDCLRDEDLASSAIAIDGVYSRNGKVAVASMSCRVRIKTASFAVPRRHVGCEQQGLRRVLPSTAGLQSVSKARAEIGESVRCLGFFCALPRFPGSVRLSQTLKLLG